MNRLRRLAKFIQGDRGVGVDHLPVEATEADKEIIRYITSNSLTLVSGERLWSAISAVKYAVNNEIAGDIVECGTWRGGCALAMKMALKSLGSSKNLYIFDTFAGMTEPTDKDFETGSRVHAMSRYRNSISGDVNKWCYASLEDVEANFSAAGCLDGVRFIKGDVMKTLKEEAVLNDLKRLSVVRLDTDWYESTKIELEVLYPRLSNSGVLLVDDYGHWDGARRAVDEYFTNAGSQPLSWVTDYTGRGMIKI